MILQTGQKKADNYLRITSLGGLGEIGKNMSVLETRNDAIIIDCGLKFPDSTMPGVDLVIPDVSYLKNKLRQVRGIFVTHGHEDHKGAIQFLLPRLGNPPVYATKLTQGLISVNLKEKKLLNTAKLKIIRTRQEVVLGDFAVEPIRVNHSIPDAVGFIIRTPVGTVVHTGDFKIDHTPVDGEPADIARLATVGDDGVTLLMSDSTNAETPGYTVSEQSIGDTIDRIFQKATGRIIVASFASNLNRIQQMIDAAAKYDRKVSVNGRSMVNNVNIAMELGYLKVPKGILVPPGRLNSLPDHKVTLITTGSQGEAYSALTRMAQGSHAQIKIKKGDTVMISASPIPGNEESIYRTIDELYRLNAKVIYSKLMDVHVSGHALQEEHKLMLNLVRPKYFMPVHGERRHLQIHGEMAKAMGVKDSNIFVMDNGHTLELTKTDATVDTRYNAGYLLVDGNGVGDIGNVVLKDRQEMSKNGMLILVINVRKDGSIIGNPEVITRGFIYIKESQDLLKEIVQMSMDIVRKASQSSQPYDTARIRGDIKVKLQEFVKERTGREPLVLPVVIAVDGGSGTSRQGQDQLPMPE